MPKPFILRIAPEVHYDSYSALPCLPGNLTATRLRLVKIALISVLAGLSIAGGMTMAFASNKAEAQGSQGGYTYTQRVCQEYGQQPRHYQVRDEMEGSD